MHFFRFRDKYRKRIIDNMLRLLSGIFLGIDTHMVRQCDPVKAANERGETVIGTIRTPTEANLWAEQGCLRTGERLIEDQIGHRTSNCGPGVGLFMACALGPAV